MRTWRCPVVMEEEGLSPLVGREVGSGRLIGWVEAPPCQQEVFCGDHGYNLAVMDAGAYSNASCGRVAGHGGHHWPCDHELMAEGHGCALGYLP